MPYNLHQTKKVYQPCPTLTQKSYSYYTFFFFLEASSAFSTVFGPVNTVVGNWSNDPTGTEAIYGLISNWDTSQVSDFSYILSSTWSIVGSFNEDISAWNTSSGTTMANAFTGAGSFNVDLSGWDVSKITDMSYAFMDCTAFNGDISSWDVGKVLTFSGMFQGASGFGTDISGWDTSSSLFIDSMFSGASSFNSDISLWDVSDVLYMESTFAYAYSFNQPLCSWEINAHVTGNLDGMFTSKFADSGFSYDQPFCSCNNAGTYPASTDGVGFLLCKNCGDGKYALANSASCSAEACTAGNFCANGDITECPPGSYSLGAASYCQQCSDTSFTDTAGSAICTSCADGNLATAEKTACFSSQVCGVGRGPTVDGSSCRVCPAGTFSDVEGSTLCELCVAGRYSTGITTSPNCDQCVGSYSTAVAAVSIDSCIPCAVGEGNNSDSTGCEDCGAGRYNEIAGGSCIACGKGKASTSVAASFESVCIRRVWRLFEVRSWLLQQSWSRGM